MAGDGEDGEMVDVGERLFRREEVRDIGIGLEKRAQQESVIQVGPHQPYLEFLSPVGSQAQEKGFGFVKEGLGSMQKVRFIAHFDP